MATSHITRSDGTREDRYILSGPWTDAEAVELRAALEHILPEDMSNWWDFYKTPSGRFMAKQVSWFDFDIDEADLAGLVARIERHYAYRWKA